MRQLFAEREAAENWIHVVQADLLPCFEFNGRCYPAFFDLQAFVKGKGVIVRIGDYLCSSACTLSYGYPLQVCRPRTELGRSALAWLQERYRQVTVRRRPRRRTCFPTSGKMRRQKGGARGR